MRRQVLRVLTVAVLCLVWIVPVKADETDIYEQQLSASGADQLMESLPQDVRDLLSSLGIEDLSYESFSSIQPQTLTKTLLDIFGDQFGQLLPHFGLVLGAVLFAAMAAGLKQTLKDDHTAEILSVLCTLAISAALLVPAAECIRKAGQACVGIAVFMLSFVPVYAALIVASGQTALAATYSTVLMGGAQCTSALLTNVAFPVLKVSLGIGAVGSLSSRRRIGALGNTLAKFSGWLISASVGLFTALLSLQSAISASADSIGQRAAKMSIGSFVPIVGGAISEAFGTVAGCVKLLRSTVGMFGVLAASLLTLPTLFQCLSWSVAVHFALVISETFGVSEVSEILKSVQTVMRTVIAVLISCAMLMIVTTTLTTTVFKGVL